MQTPSKRHLPIVGLVGLLVLAAAGGTIYYYQFVVAHPSNCSPPVHRLIFMTAIIQELGGFTITNAAIVNGTALPSYNNVTGQWNFTGVHYQNYATNNKTMTATPGDTVTLYIIAKNSTDPAQERGIPGHGFSLSPIPGNLTGIVPSVLAFNGLYTITFVATQPMTYACTVFCSKEHPSMNGSINVGCG